MGQPTWSLEGHPGFVNVGERHEYSLQNEAWLWGLEGRKKGAVYPQKRDVSRVLVLTGGQAG